MINRFVIMFLLLLTSSCDIQETPVAYTVNDPSDPNSTWKTERPLSLDEALRIGKCPILLPNEATNIQYVDFYAGYSGFSRYVRFEAPSDICLEHAKTIIETHNLRQTQNGQRVEMNPKPLAQLFGASLSASARNGEIISQAGWFDIDTVMNGKVWGDNRSHTPVIVVDLERGIFYFHISD